MRRKLLPFLGVSGVLLILLICTASVIVSGVVGWWFWGEDGQSRLIRIVSLAPLTTPVASQTSEQTEEPLDAAIVEAVSTAETQLNEAEPTTSEEIEKALGFAVPEGAVNSITNQGLANRLVIPKLNVDAPIVLSPIESETWKVDHLGSDKVGHLEGTAPAGSSSNMVLAAHVTVSAGVYGPFAGLAQLAPGDVVVVYDEGQEYEYVVDGYQLVDRTAIQVTNPTKTGQITLITCSNWDHNEGRYVERLIVTGHLAGS